ncbi:hypothetical protein [Nocardia harenae]|uniref:hypothetical protein n=1 Tax=Nocardia harenae TaxID=358707 RepID=UPI0012EE5CD3|nr:hypothetical protein [Nocardia harenae]
MIDWLQAGELPGIAVSGCRLPALGGLRKVLRTGLDTDLLVFTPRSCVVIDIEMPAEPMTGEMQCPAEEPWRMAGVAGDPIAVRLRDTNPLDRLTETVEAVKAVLDTGDSAAEVLGLLVVVPFAGVPITMNVDREGLPAGTDVLLAEDPHQLYERLAAVDQVRAVSWTAEGVGGALDVLVGEQHGLTDEQLVAVGFPAAGSSAPVAASAVAGPAGMPAAAAATAPTAGAVAPPAPAAAEPPAGASGVRPAAGPEVSGAATGSPVPQPAAGTVPAPPDPASGTTGPGPADPAPPAGTAPIPAEPPAGATTEGPHADPSSPLHSVARERSPLTSILLALLGLTAFGTALWLFSQCAAADDAAPGESTPLPVQTVADRPEPVPAPPPASRTVTCYPFQPGC